MNHVSQKERCEVADEQRNWQNEIVHQENSNQIQSKSIQVEPINQSSLITDKINAMFRGNFFEINQSQQSKAIHTINNKLFESGLEKNNPTNDQAEKLNHRFDETMNKILYESRSIKLKREDNNLCFERHDLQTGKKLIGLVDLMNEENYILSEMVKHGNKFKLKNSFFIETNQGKIEISHFVKVHLFSHSMRFFLADYLDGFDLTLGRNGLKIIDAKIDFFSLELIYKNKIERSNDICSNKSIENKNEKIIEGKNVKKRRQNENVKNVEIVKKDEIKNQLHWNYIERMNRRVVKKNVVKGKNSKVKSSKFRRPIFEKENVKELARRTNKMIFKEKSAGTDENFRKLKKDKIQKTVKKLNSRLKFKPIFNISMKDFKYFEPG